MAYNGPETIRKKTEFALGQKDAEQKFAGLMIWEIGQNAPGDASLLRVIENAIDTLPQRFSMSEVSDCRKSIARGIENRKPSQTLRCALLAVKSLVHSG